MEYKKSVTKNKKNTYLNLKWQSPNALNKVAFKRSRKFVKNHIISEIVRSTLSARYICVILLLTAIVLMSIYYKSILIYWQQTYHSELLDSDTLSEDTNPEELEKDISEDITAPEDDLISEEKMVTDESNQSDEPDESTKSIEAIEENRSESKEIKLETKEDILRLFTEDKSLEEESPELEIVDPNTKSETTQQTKQETISNTEDKVEEKVQQLSTDVKTIETQVTPIDQNDQLEILPDDASLIDDPIPIVLTQNDKVFFAGDSLMQGVAPYVKKMLFKQYKIESIDLSKRSTGLSYPKAFDWPKTINDKLSEDPSIKLLVVFLGANDPWDFPVKGYATNARFKSKLWEKQYRLRIASILDHVQKHRVQVLWLAPPCMRKQKLNDGMVYLNKLYQSELEKTQQHFLTTNELLGCSYEKFNSFVETNKEKIRVRVDDGVHFTPSGQKILAKAIMEKIIFKKLEDVHSE
ncbi:hypothetical protein B6D12_04750 [Gilliamella apicola]|uniref:SGNH/GDSL hydrolase family protein n=1 Tax=Gilliamella apicola TaxID=1196095 RepID=UPI000A3405C9|nr:DUF459 domain-containing protein [Gilliamella apicola]OTP89762.1 hypothetical protein B5S41_05780 [Gilliamella apicola]OTP94815.1 hypothetical protein B6D13_06195 [Gilliamella apicola]OTP96726.1 hypothetical protein B6D05_03705 [Gilliamella apicola]OTQ02588.1 hypothetical protein B6D07_04660 [Gilliamella apicola]OTQ06115.1 hypothetical protein B6D12_04750 [Gilliamella apicola]